MIKNSKRVARIARHKRVRRKVMGTPERPRMSVFRSSRHISVQIIDDINAQTIVSASTQAKELREGVSEAAANEKSPDAKKSKKKPMGRKEKAAQQVGQEVARKAREKGIEQVIFDRGGYKFHGRVKALADAARKAGIKF